MVKLLYQTASKEYIEFLRDKNVTNTKGLKLYDQWVANGKSTPVVMKQSEFFTSSLGIVNAELKANAIKVYPNPASNTVHIKIGNRVPKSLKVDLYTLNGVKINSAFKIDNYQNQQIIDLDTSNLASGTYIIKLNVDGKSSSRLLVIN